MEFEVIFVAIGFGVPVLCLAALGIFCIIKLMQEMWK